MFEEARAGDARALDAVLRPVGLTVLVTARRILGDRFRAEAEDVAQDSLLAVARALPEIRDEAALPAYAVRTTVRNAMRARRRAQKNIPLERQAASAEPAASLESEAHRRRQADALLALLDELPRVQAEALFMRVALDRSLGEIAQSLGTPINTIRSRVRLARLAIKKKIEKRPQIRALLEW